MATLCTIPKPPSSEEDRDLHDACLVHRGERAGADRPVYIRRSVCETLQSLPDHLTFIPVETASGVVMVHAVVSPTGGPQDIADSGYERLTRVLGTVREFAADMVQAVEGLAISRASVDFGVTFCIHGGKLVAAFVDVGQECAFKLTLEWTPAE
jgi:Trypsin-co-occurring domain 1